MPGFRLMAILGAALFSGAAMYINLVEHPARMECGTRQRTALAEHTSLSFRAEAFNLFNHPIYASPFNNISTPARFGQITSALNSGVVGTGTPRRLQFMLRLDF